MLDTSRTLEAQLAAATQAYSEGAFDDASRLARAVLDVATGDAGASNLAGLAELGLGNADEAARHFRRACQLDPDNAEYPNNLGVLLHAQGRFAEAREALEAALAIDPLMAQAANNLGSVTERLGEDTTAIASYRRALDVDPAFVEARDNLLAATTRVAPPWHFPMMADHARNAAYAEALARVAPGRHVLDIGSGSGLLAMIAAQAGARRVDTCEMHAAVAEVAARVVRDNALADQVGVWPVRSNDLLVGRELPARAEVLVTETFSSTLLAEQILSTMEDAHERLLAEDAVVIPRRAAAMGYLIGGDYIERHFFAGAWSGLDLTAFDFLAPSTIGLHLDRVPHEALSADFEIFGFDLTARRFPAERREMVVQATRAGRCVGVAQWIQLDLDASVTYANRPTAEAGSNGWMHVVHRFARPVDLRVGDRVPIAMAHNRSTIAVGLITPPRG